MQPLAVQEAARDSFAEAEAADTAPRSEDTGTGELADGTRVSAETFRRLSCDTELVGVLRGAAGEVLDVGRRRRTVSPALRRAREVRWSWIPRIEWEINYALFWDHPRFRAIVDGLDLPYERGTKGA